MCTSHHDVHEETACLWSTALKFIHMSTTAEKQVPHFPHDHPHSPRPKHPPCSVQCRYQLHVLTLLICQTNNGVCSNIPFLASRISRRSRIPCGMQGTLAQACMPSKSPVPFVSQPVVSCCSSSATRWDAAYGHLYSPWSPLLW